MHGLLQRFHRALVTTGVVALALSCSSLLLPLTGCDKRALDTASEDQSWKVSPRVFAGDLTEDELRTADWVRIEASRAGTVIAYAETLFSARSVNLTIPTQGAVTISISGYADRNRTTLLWRGASNVESGTRDPIIGLARMPGLIPVPKPRFSVDSGVFRGTVKIGMATDSAELDIHYTTDGGDPSASSPRYTDSIVVERSTVLSAVAYRKGRALSEIKRAYIQVRRDTVAAPKFSETSGSYARILEVRLTCDTSGAVIRYTTDGTVPTDGSPEYSNPIRMASSGKIKAFATKNGLVSSDVITFEYTINLPKLSDPRFSPTSGRFDTAQRVEITADSGATIHYTLVQGETPTSTSPVYAGAIRVDSTTTISAIAMMEGSTNSSVASATFSIVPPGSVASPWAVPAGDTYKQAQSVVLSSDPGTEIRYTLDGSVPGASSNLYTGPISVARDLTIRAISTKVGMTSSSIFTAHYRIAPDTVSAPRFSPGSEETYEAGVQVSIVTDTADAEIHYTLDGGVPSANSARYTGSISLDSTTTIRAVAIKPGLVNSEIATARYSVRKKGALPVPMIAPHGGDFRDSVVVSLRSDTSDAILYYTLDGSPPTTASNRYTSAIVLRSTTTLKAIATRSGLVSSDVASADFTIQIAGKAESPRFSPGGGSFDVAKQVVIYTLDTTLAIHFTTDGSAPTTSSPLYVEPIRLSDSTVLKAIAIKEGLQPSDIASAPFAIAIKALDTAKAPEFSPNGGSFTDQVRIGLSSATTEAIIHYTLDGTEPDVSSMVYGDSIELVENGTVKAMACKSGLVCSKSVEAKFVVVARDTVATPTFSPAGGTFNRSQSVAIQCATPDAILYYTLDGTAPNTQSDRVSGPISVDSSMTIKVWAYRDGMVPREIVRASYTILRSTATPTFSLSGNDTLRAATKIGLGCATTGASIHYTLDGTDPDSLAPLYQDSLTITSSLTVKAVAYASGLLPSGVAQTDYVYAELGTIVAPTISPSGILFIGSSTVAITPSVSNGTTWYTTDGTDPTTSSTRKQYTVPFAVSATTTVKAFTEASGMKASAVRSATLTLTTQVATPVITPATGSFPASQTVTITCGTTGATIYYTLDGNTPTTSSSIYSAAFSVASTKTVKAMAIQSGKIASAVATSAITILPKLAVPTFNIKTGTYSTIQTVTMSPPVTGATIYYTMDGTEPTTTSNKYSTAITVDSTHRITAMAVMSGYANSGTNSILVTIDLPNIDTLTYSLGSSASTLYFVGSKLLTITSPVAGATIYYTTDNTVPTRASSIYSTKGITISKNTTVKAIAVKTGYDQSPVKSATYGIRCYAPVFDTVPGTYTKSVFVTMTSSTAGASIYYTIDGTTPEVKSGVVVNGKKYSSPVSVSYSQTLKAIAVLDGLTNSLPTTGSYTISQYYVATKTPTVAFSPEGSKFAGSTTVTLTPSIVGSVIYYTTDWSEPTQESGILYKGPITVSKTTTIKARAYNGTNVGIVKGQSYIATSL